MKRVSIQIVFICVLFFLYYFYSAWISSLNKENLVFQIFDPFKLILLGMIFTVIYSAIKGLLFSRFVNLKNYRQNLQNNILFEFENTINYVKSLEKIIQENNVQEAKVFIKNFKSISYKPIYLIDFIEKLAENLLLEKEISSFASAIKVIIENIETNFEEEKKRVLNNQKGWLEIKKVDSYYSNSSWDSIKYNMALNNIENDKKNRWKISSLYILKFKNALFLSFLINLVIFAIIGVVFYYQKYQITRIFFIAFVCSMYLISIINYNVSIIYLSKKRNIKIYWSHLFVYYIIITIVFANVILNLAFSPGLNFENKEENVPWYNKKLLNFLKYLLYIVFSTMLLTYVFGGLLELLEVSKFNLINAMKTFIIPFIVFAVTLALNIISIKNCDDKIYFINFIILIGFWSFIGIWNKVLSNN